MTVDAVNSLPILICRFWGFPPPPGEGLWLIVSHASDFREKRGRRKKYTKIQNFTTAAEMKLYKSTKFYHSWNQKWIEMLLDWEHMI